MTDLEQSNNIQASELDENEQIAFRKAKLSELRKIGNPYPNHFRRDCIAAELHAHYGAVSAENLEKENRRCKVSGRIMTRRLMGKASFVHLQDASGRIQLYLRKQNLPEDYYEQFKKWDIGDIIGAEGTLFKTKTGELTIKVDDVALLTKSLRPLPDKYHGLADQEVCYRQRYLDLLSNEQTRNVFLLRSKIISFIRDYLNEKCFLEVETPMMQVIAGGALARPFITKHNTLDMDLFLRIAPELYLKRLIVGGFERVFEINRNFRNEGISTQHNPEFTMLEFYQAYADYRDLIDLTEDMLRALAINVLGTTTINYQGQSYDLAKPFQRFTVKEAILHFNSDIQEEMLDDMEQAKNIATKLAIPLKETYGLGKIQIEIFEKTAESRLQEPTFITSYPTEVSPLARRNEVDPFVTDRFEFFIAGKEIANGFSELNDPEDQAERFRMQMAEKSAGDLEAMPYDEDYIIALEHGMPPTAGEGIGIDRLTMIFTDSPSIRDVILFPHMKPKGIHDTTV